MSDPDIRKVLDGTDLDAIVRELIGIGKAGEREYHDDVVRFLDHQDWAVRGAAIRVLAFYWRLPAYRDTALTMALNDPDEEVQADALLGWSSQFEGTRDPAALQIAERLLRDANRDDLVRAEALRAIYRICGQPIWELMKPGRDVFNETQIDWGKVDAMLADARELPGRQS